ncbi:hypothetical protein AFLA_013689 [Aspergillus flavus NRRL3357]|nr:hypothetical protein AFLA_013689 [Aspergillus flavus NRRL3357]
MDASVYCSVVVVATARTITLHPALASGGVYRQGFFGEIQYGHMLDSVLWPFHCLLPRAIEKPTTQWFSQ